jgi:hypothetical protein
MSSFYSSKRAATERDISITSSLGIWRVLSPDSEPPFSSIGRGPVKVTIISCKRRSLETTQSRRMTLLPYENECIYDLNFDRRIAVSISQR